MPRQRSLAILSGLILIGLLSNLQAAGDSPVAVSSPDGNLTITFSLKDLPAPHATGLRAYYRVAYKGTDILADSPLGLTLVGDKSLNQDFEYVASRNKSHDSTWENRFGAQRTIPDKYNELTVVLRERAGAKRTLELIFRAYDEGVALRYSIPKQDGLDRLTIASEDTGFCFAAEASAFALNLGRFNTHNEGEYPRTPLTEIKPDSIINLPLVVEMPAGPWVALLEADLTDYAGMYVGGMPGVKNALRTKLSPTPGRKADEIVIAKTPMTTPWRVLMVGPTAGSLVEHNYLPLNLSPPCAIADTSWIQPGKAAWDWWSGSYAKDVPFEPGMNTATMKHYIDFAAASKFEYMLVDAGWCPSGKTERSEDILNYRPEVDIPEIIAYGKQKGVKTLLWVDWLPLSTKIDEAFALYAKWGASGVKIDYMNRDDQEMVAFYNTCIRKAAEHRLTVDYHGAYKGTGLRRTYPNLLTREGVMGMEFCKWSERVTPEYDVTIPFTRMLAGPMDFTPGAFNNAAKGQFKVRDIAPMSQGTRCHQLAMYVVYESPLVMVSDYPEAYKNQPGFEFIEKVPSVWDESKVLSGEPAKYIVMARRNGDKWYIGAMTNWDARDVEIPLSFLDDKDYVAMAFADGEDADKVGTSVATNKRNVKAGDTLKLHLAPGGGAAVILSPKNAKPEPKASDAMTPIDLRKVKVGGEFGRRIDTTVKNNLLAIDIEKDFLAPFHKGEYTGLNDGSGPFVGLGNLINSTVCLAAHTGNEALLARKKHLVEETLKCQEPDGYLGMLPPEKRTWTLWDCHEQGYLIHGLVTDFQLFGEERSLDAARKLGDYLVRRWPGKPANWDKGLPCCEDLALTGFERTILKLYAATGDRRYLDLCVEQQKTPDWNLDIVLGRHGAIQGHVACYLSHCLAQLELYRLQPAEKLLTPTRRAIDFMTAKNGMTITGGSGRDECWADDQNGQGTHGETCATAYQIFVYDSLLRLQGDTRWGDLIERTLYNVGFGAQSPDGRKLRYYAPFEGDRVYFDPDSYCCPNNYRRLIAILPQLIYYRTDQGVAVNLYSDSQATLEKVGDASVVIRQETDYPTSGNVKLFVNPSQPAKFPLLLRIPRWCQEASVAINGKPVEATATPGSFCKLEREWKSGDTITLDLPMKWRLVAGRKTQAGRAAVMRGPVVYTLNPAQVPGLDAAKIDSIELIPSSIEPVVANDSVRPGGTACRVKADYGKADRGDLTLLLTEFPDPDGKKIYFRLPDPRVAVEDELLITR